MPISDRDRKILWAKSGNRCAICRQVLVVEGNVKDRDSVIGDECHIRGKKPNGPRSPNNINRKAIDAYQNLILLCKIHHKTIDDQENTYTEEYLSNIKSAHEKWVHDTLNFSKKIIEPLTISKSFFNGGLKNLVRIDIEIDFSNNIVKGNYQIIMNYSTHEENRLSYLFSGYVVSNHLIFIDFNGEILPYETDPSLKSFGSDNDVWRLNEFSNSIYSISINTYGKNYVTEDLETYIMTMEEQKK